MQENAYRTSASTLELEELRKHNKKLTKENERFRKVFSLREYLQDSWRRSEVAFVTCVTLLGGVLLVLVMQLLVLGSYRGDVVEWRAVEYAATNLRSSKVEVRCTNEGIANTDHLELCIVHRDSDYRSEVRALSCDETRCVLYQWLR